MTPPRSGRLAVSDWSTGKPDFDRPRIGVNARLFDDFELEAVPVNPMNGEAYQA